MNAAEKLDLTQFDEVFGNIAKLYDHAENILKMAYHDSVDNREEFIGDVEALVKRIEESANTIAEDFSKVVESGKDPSNAMKLRVASALRKILITIDEYKQRVNN